MGYKCLLLVAILFANVSGCSDGSGSGVFEFGVSDQTGKEVPDVSVTFSDQRHWDMGVTEPNGYKSIGQNLGPIPDAADIRWTDGEGHNYSQHLKITPLPPPTRTSYMGDARVIAFVLHADGTAEVVYHFPLSKN